MCTTGESATGVGARPSADDRWQRDGCRGLNRCWTPSVFQIASPFCRRTKRGSRRRTYRGHQTRIKCTPTTTMGPLSTVIITPLWSGKTNEAEKTTEILQSRYAPANFAYARRSSSKTYRRRATGPGRRAYVYLYRYIRACRTPNNDETIIVINNARAGEGRKRKRAASFHYARCHSNRRFSPRIYRVLMFIMVFFYS